MLLSYEVSEILAARIASLALAEICKEQGIDVSNREHGDAYHDARRYSDKIKTVVTEILFGNY